MNTLERLIANLRILASIPEGAKLSTCKEFFSVDHPHLLQFIIRASNNSSRLHTVIAIRKEVELAIYLLGLMNKYNDEQLLDTLRDALKKSIRGINSLCDTYRYDTNTVMSLTLIIADIKEAIGGNQTSHPMPL